MHTTWSFWCGRRNKFHFKDFNMPVKVQKWNVRHKNRSRIFQFPPVLQSVHLTQISAWMDKTKVEEEPIYGAICVLILYLKLYLTLRALYVYHRTAARRRNKQPPCLGAHLSELVWSDSSVNTRLESSTLLSRKCITTFSQRWDMGPNSTLHVLRLFSAADTKIQASEDRALKHDSAVGLCNKHTPCRLQLAAFFFLNKYVYGTICCFIYNKIHKASFAPLAAETFM